MVDWVLSRIHAGNGRGGRSWEDGKAERKAKRVSATGSVNLIVPFWIWESRIAHSVIPKLCCDCQMLFFIRMMQ
jgi:hypothetical protein